MALKLSLYDKKTDFTYPEAYARVGLYKGDKSSIQIYVDVFANQAAKETRKEPISSMMFNMPFTEITGEFLPSIYHWLKLQPLFLTAQDC